LQSSARVIVPVDDTDEGAVELAGVVHYVWAERPRAVFPALEFTATVPFDAEDEDSVQESRKMPPVKDSRTWSLIRAMLLRALSSNADAFAKLPRPR
jgi:hypothetical protein